MNKKLAIVMGVMGLILTSSHPSHSETAQSERCSPAYPGLCIPPAPPDLNCKDITHRNFKVSAPDPHKFDLDKDGIGCEG